MQTSKKEVRGS